MLNVPLFRFVINVHCSSYKHAYTCTHAHTRTQTLHTHTYTTHTYTTHTNTTHTYTPHMYMVRSLILTVILFPDTDQTTNQTTQKHSRSSQTHTTDQHTQKGLVIYTGENKQSLP